MIEKGMEWSHHRMSNALLGVMCSRQHAMHVRHMCACVLACVHVLIHVRMRACMQASSYHEREDTHPL